MTRDVTAEPGWSGVLAILRFMARHQLRGHDVRLMGTSTLPGTRRAVEFYRCWYCMATLEVR